MDRCFCPLQYIDFEFVHLLLLVQMHSTGNLAPNPAEQRWHKEGTFNCVNHSLNGWNLVITVIEPSLFSFKHQRLETHGLSYPFSYVKVFDLEKSVRFSNWSPFVTDPPSSS